MDVNRKALLIQVYDLNVSIAIKRNEIKIVLKDEIMTF